MMTPEEKEQAIEDALGFVVVDEFEGNKVCIRINDTHDIWVFRDEDFPEHKRETFGGAI